MAQWLPTPRAQATFMSVFPYGVDVGTNVLLGSNQPIDYNPQRILDRLQEPAIVEYLERGQVDVDAIRALVQTGTPRLWTPESARNESDINTDLFPKDEYYLNVALP